VTSTHNGADQKPQQLKLLLKLYTKVHKQTSYNKVPVLPPLTLTTLCLFTDYRRSISTNRSKRPFFSRSQWKRKRERV